VHQLVGRADGSSSPPAPPVTRAAKPTGEAAAAAELGAEALGVGLLGVELTVPCAVALALLLSASTTADFSDSQAAFGLSVKQRPWCSCRADGQPACDRNSFTSDEPMKACSTRLRLLSGCRRCLAKRHMELT
jgi:hypothetical protein